MQTERRNKSIDIHQSACTTSTCLPLWAIYATEERDRQRREEERKRTMERDSESITRRYSYTYDVAGECIECLIALIYTSYWQLELSTTNGPTSSDIRISIWRSVIAAIERRRVNELNMSLSTNVSCLVVACCYNKKPNALVFKYHFESFTWKWIPVTRCTDKCIFRADSTYSQQPIQRLRSFQFYYRTHTRSHTISLLHSFEISHNRCVYGVHTRKIENCQQISVWWLINGFYGGSMPLYECLARYSTFGHDLLRTFSCERRPKADLNR